MTITTLTARAQYNGNGATTEFAIPFEFLTTADVLVIHTDSSGVDTTWVLDTQYGVTNADGTPITTRTQPATGKVVVDTSPTDYTPATGETLTILRNQALTQSASYTPGDSFPAKAHEKALDRLSMQIQQEAERLDRAPKFKQTSTTSGITFPEPEADKLVGWNAAGDDLENKIIAQLGTIEILDEDDMASNSATKPPSQQSVKAFVEGKIIDEDDMASDSATKVPTQQSVKAYADTMLPLVGATLAADMIINSPSNFVEVRKDSSPLNYAGTYAALVVQQRDADAGSTNSQRPGVVFQFRSTGDGEVTSGSELSQSIWLGVQGSMQKDGDGSGHSFTAIGELGEYGAGEYNELGGFIGTLTNVGSLHGTLAGVEMLLRDSPDAGANDYDTNMNAVIGRVGRYNSGSRKARNFYASSEGTVALDAVLGVNSAGLHSWVTGIDFLGATFTSGQAIVFPNNNSIAWRNGGNSANLPVLFMSGLDATWLSGSAIHFANAALAIGFEVVPVTNAVNYVRAVSTVASGSPLFAVQGTDTNISMLLRGKGTGGGSLQDGGAAAKFQWNTTGVGFFGATPAARGALAAPSGTITRTTFATSSVTLPQLAERVYAIINDLRAYGLFS